MNNPGKHSNVVGAAFGAHGCKQNTLEFESGRPHLAWPMELIIFSIAGSGLLITAHWLTLVRDRFFASN